jgi:uncharacterized protein YbjT (DUF2867 family)
MKILLTTPAGTIGRRVLGELLAPEFSLRVIAREPARLGEEIRDQVEVVRGSSDDPAALRRALAGVEAMFWCIPTGALPDSDFRRHYQRFAHAARLAVREAGTPRIVTLSAAGKGLGRNDGAVSGLRAMEEILNECGAAVRHLRSVPFMENLLWQAQSICHRGILAGPIPGHVPISMVAARDVADVALRWLVRRDWAGIESLYVHGPEQLTGAQAAAITGRVLNRPVQYRAVSADHYVHALASSGAAVPYARSLVDIYADLADAMTDAPVHAAQSAAPTTLAAWVKSELVPVIASSDSSWKAEPACATVCEA